MTLFWILAFLTVPAALTVVLHRNPVYSALALVFTLFQVAIMFVALDAFLIAFLQVIVYAGAILVLILFAIMLLSLEPEEPSPERSTIRAWGWGLAALLGLELGAVATMEHSGSAEAGPADFGSVTSVATELFSTHMLPFELTSILLLVAVVGAVVLARRRS
ncbi:MAG: NADH-quinone oxidoreductase subunit J [Candidatus Binatia bacterium]|nr:NADH-quinone oxidoreductase subunit J [Candidatus Binatia bacterium]